MRKVSNWIVGFLAAAVCAGITYITRDASYGNILYNLAFLAAMIIILIVGCGIGFGRMKETREGLDRAMSKLKRIADHSEQMASVTTPGATFFEIPYYDAKYQEYLYYLRKTNSPTDIGDYIGEYEINNYTHRRLVEMIPDILTSLGILGTFVGLVLGLRGFNPTSYEAMSSSVDSLIDGIKVAFVTSIYGISLSLAFSYWLRGALTGVSESLDRFLDAYYTTAVTPTDATAMNHIIANQNAQIKVMSQMQKDLAEQVSQTLSNNIGPMVSHLNETMDDFSKTVTLQQGQLLENISQRIARTMKQEFFSEFVQMRKVMNETNKVQADHVQFMQNSEKQYQENILEGQTRMKEAMESSADFVTEVYSAMHAQEEELSKFVTDMQKTMSSIAEVNDTNLKMTRQMERLSEMNGAVAEKLTEITELSEQYTKSLAAVQADNSDLSEGLSVMNDANIRMTDKISKMNDLTVSSLQEAGKAQAEFIKTADGYMQSMQQMQDTLLKETKTQQEHLRQFTDYMTQALAGMKSLAVSGDTSMKELGSCIDRLVEENEKSEKLAEKENLAQLVQVLRQREEREAAREKAEAEKPRRRGLFGR